MSLRLVILLTLLVHIAFAGSRVTVSLNAVSLGASPLAIGVMLSLYALLPMLFSVRAGRWVDRIGPRLPMRGAAAATALGAIVAGALPGLTPLYFTATLVGSGFMLFHIAATQIVGHLGTPADRGRNFSLFAMGFSISGFLGPTLAGFAIDGLGYESAFLALALFPLASLAVLGRRSIPARAHAGPRPAEAGRGALDLLATLQLRLVFVSSALLSMAWDVYSFVVPIHAARMGLSASTIGSIMGTFAVATFTMRLTLPLLQRKLSEWHLILAAVATACAVYLVFPVVTLVPLLFVLAFVLGLGLGAAQPMVLSLIFSHAPAERAAEAVGIRSTLINASQTFMPLLFGAFGAAFGVSPVFWAMSALLAGGVWLIRRR